MSFSLSRFFNVFFHLIVSLIVTFSASICMADNGVDLDPGLIPVPRIVSFSWMSLETWQQKFASQNAIADQGGVDLLFLGDSITEGWDQAIWTQHFSHYHPANFAIGGDHTGNILWRLQNGHYGKLKPKLVVLLIGVNNIGLFNAAPKQLSSAIEAVLNNLHTLFPEAKILLNGIFPFEESGLSPKRAIITESNQALVLLADEKQVYFRNYGGLFMQKNGDISKEMMRDFLHLTPAAYQLWADAMTPDIQKLMQR